MADAIGGSAWYAENADMIAQLLAEYPGRLNAAEYARNLLGFTTISPTFYDYFVHWSSLQ